MITLERVLENGVKIRYSGHIISINSLEFLGQDQELNDFVGSIESFLRNYGVINNGNVAGFLVDLDNQ